MSKLRYFLRVKGEDGFYPRSGWHFPKGPERLKVSFWLDYDGHSNPKRPLPRRSPRESKNDDLSLDLATALFGLPQGD